MSEQTNPWLEITKQKTVDRPGLGDIKYLYFHPEPLTHFLTQNPLIPEEWFDPDDIKAANYLIELVRVQGLSFSAFINDDEVWGQFIREEAEEIYNFIAYAHGKTTSDLIDYLYENGFWQK